MAAPVIALRFRDSTPGVNTIDAHMEIIAARQEVWWGWWRKAAETSRAEDVPSGTYALLLVDRAARRMFHARCGRFTANGWEVDPSLIPEYYRKRVREIEGFFQLTGIEETRFDQDLADRLGERTFMRINEPPPSGEHLAAPASAPDRTSVLHLSDLHFGADYGFLPQGQRAGLGDAPRTLTDCMMADLARLGLDRDIAAIVVTGDFITRGDWKDRVRRMALSEFEALRDALGLSKEQVIAVPGNHDIVRYPDGADIDIEELAVAGQTNQQHEREFRTFAEELVGRNWQQSLNYVRRIALRGAEIQVCVLNSCTISGTKWREYGLVGDGGMDAIRALARLNVDGPTYRFLALHHHLLPVAEVEAPASQGVTLALDASKILAEAQAAGVHVALHGHQHKAKLATYSNIPFSGPGYGHPLHIVANGSAGVAIGRLPNGETNSYCIFTVEAEGLRLRMRELRTNGNPGSELFDRILGAAPALRLWPPA
jgi:3',5'-cyclic AMP phosphodiesterase CpdA